MYLTKRQLEEIARQIASISKKDSDFDETEIIQDNDFVAIVQDGVNKRILITKLKEGLEPGSVVSLDDLSDVEFENLTSGQFISYNGTKWVNVNNPGGGGGSGSVTSVAMTVPTGLSVSGSPITTSGTLAVSYATGYSIPTTDKQGQWDGKQDALVSGTNIKTINSQSILGSGNLNIGGGGGATALDDLTDVDLTSPTAGQQLIYDGTNWINGASGNINYMKVTSAQYATMQSGGTLSNSILYIIVD